MLIPVLSLKNLISYPFHDIYLAEIGKVLMFQYKAGLLPISFDNMFLLSSQVHGFYFYNTRNASLFYVPKCRTNIRLFSFQYKGPKLFNSLCPEIQNATSVAVFKYKLKQYLLS